MFTLLCPTRGRVQYAKQLLISFRNTQKYENQLLFYLQEDDEKLDDYIKLFDKMNHKDYKIGPYYRLHSIHYDYLANYATGEYLMEMDDDVIIHSKNWDEKMHQKVSQYKDKIFVGAPCEYSPRIAMEKNWRDWWLLSTKPFVHRKFYEILGYFVPPCFAHQMIDDWISLLGYGLNRFCYFPNIYFEHFIMTGKRIEDKVTDFGNENYLDSYYTWSKAERWFQSDLFLLNEYLEISLPESELIDNYRTIMNKHHHQTGTTHLIWNKA